jgi:predicted transcriptional regulator
MAQRALRAVAAASDQLHAAEHAQRDAIRAAHDAGASLRQIATEAVLSHEQVRRIVQADPEFPYYVTVERRGVSPLQTQLLVRAATPQAAAELASCIAERARDGMFEATKVRRAARKVSAFPSQAYDDADLD